MPEKRLEELLQNKYRKKNMGKGGKQLLERSDGVLVSSI